MKTKPSDTAEWLRRGGPWPTSKTGSMEKRLTVGKPDDGWTPESKDDHKMFCPVCGEMFDMRRLDQALAHWHDGPVETGMPTMKLEEISLIAQLPAIEPAVGPHGKLLGYPAANAISATLEEAGLVIVKRDDLEKLQAGMESVLKALRHKKIAAATIKEVAAK